MYDANDSKQISRTELKDGGAFAVSFHPDGATVAAGGFDGKIRLLDAATGEVKQEFYPIELETEVAANE